MLPPISFKFFPLVVGIFSMLSCRCSSLKFTRSIGLEPAGALMYSFKGPFYCYLDLSISIGSYLLSFYLMNCLMKATELFAGTFTSRFSGVLLNKF